jgi:hypothetical protein
LRESDVGSFFVGCALLLRVDIHRLKFCADGSDRAKIISVLINENSPLRRLPNNLKARQAQFFDAIRFAAETVDLAYQGLLAHLLTLAGPDVTNPQVSASVAFLYAWSMVDSAHRLHGLIENLPGLAKKNQSPEFRKFSEKADSVEKLRNVVQHMETEIYKSAEAGKAVWGTLSWLRATRPGETIYTCLLVSGAMMPGGSHQFINPAGLQIKMPIDHVTLTQGGTSVNLTEVVDAIAAIIRLLEKALEKEFAQFPERAGSDMIIAMAFQPGSTKPITPVAADEQTSNSGQEIQVGKATENEDRE